MAKNDYNISPSRYIHTSDAETYRPISEIVAELDTIEAEAKETDKALRRILKQLGVEPQMTQMNADSESSEKHLRKSAPSAVNLQSKGATP